VLKEKEALEAAVAAQLAADEAPQEEKIAKAVQMGLSKSERLAAGRLFEETKLNARVVDACAAEIQSDKILKATKTKPSAAPAASVQGGAIDARPKRPVWIA